MRYATKKECAGLLALLGEESLAAIQKRNEQQKAVRVSWVGEHIITLAPFEGQLLARVTGVFPAEYANEVEERMSHAAMREAGYYHLSTRILAGFVLAEITVYGMPQISDPAFRQELEAMCGRLDAICRRGCST